MKIIRSELYIKNLDFKQVNDRWSNFLNELKSFINGDISMYDGTYQDEEVIGIYLEVKAHSFKECESYFILSKKLILKYFNKIPKQITKIKLQGLY